MMDDTRYTFSILIVVYAWPLPVSSGPNQCQAGEKRHDAATRT